VIGVYQDEDDALRAAKRGTLRDSWYSWEVEPYEVRPAGCEPELTDTEKALSHQRPRTGVTFMGSTGIGIQAGDVKP
jgi:hypothetical protein